MRSSSDKPPTMKDDRRHVSESVFAANTHDARARIAHIRRHRDTKRSPRASAALVRAASTRRAHGRASKRAQNTKKTNRSITHRACARRYTPARWYSRRRRRRATRVRRVRVAMRGGACREMRRARANGDREVRALGGVWDARDMSYAT